MMFWVCLPTFSMSQAAYGQGVVAQNTAWAGIVNQHKTVGQVISLMLPGNLCQPVIQGWRITMKERYVMPTLLSISHLITVSARRVAYCLFSALCSSNLFILDSQCDAIDLLRGYQDTSGCRKNIWASTDWHSCVIDFVPVLAWPPPVHILAPAAPPHSRVVRR
jgi:hypothetical protein